MRSSAVRLLKQSTFLTGVVVHTNPLPALASVYQTTLSALGHLPPTFPYRQATEALTQHRLSVVEQAMKTHGITPDNVEGSSPGQGDQAVRAVESTIEGGMQVEQLLDVARREETLVARMIDWKASVHLFACVAPAVLDGSAALTGFVGCHPPPPQMGAAR
jgi:NADH dehydrogenase (ubiquinone) 1 alpha subcomplex subunit 5